MGHLKNTRYINIPVYNVSMEDDILNLDTSIGITLVFPNVQDSGCMYADKRWYVNDATGGAAANPVTITAVSGIQINDAASQQLSTANFGACVFATNQQKYVITGSGGSGGTTIVTSPFTPSNTAIVVGDDFQEVAEKSQGQINDIVTNVTTLQNNEYKITYFAEINAATGTITKPTGSTILLDQFAGGVDAYVSTITNGQPTGDFPETAGGVLVDVTSFDTSGNFVLSGTPSAYPCALIYTLKISAADYQNLTTANILEAESSFGKAPIVSPVFQTSINGAFLTASLPLVTDSNKNIVSRSISNFRSDIGVDAGTIIVTSGTSFTTPSNITTSTIFFIELVGAGGGGGGRSATNLSGSGGGGGGYCFVKVTGLSPSTSYTCAIGSGGAGGADGASGVDGGSTTLTIGATTYTASGGIKGVKTNSSNGGAGGTGTNGDINMEGQRGWASVAVASTAILAAQGGNSPKSWGNGGAAKYSDVVADGTGYGGGGASSKFGAGSNGSSGIIYAQYIN